MAQLDSPAALAEASTRSAKAAGELPKLVSSSTVSAAVSAAKKELEDYLSSSPVDIIQDLTSTVKYAANYKIKKPAKKKEETENEKTSTKDTLASAVRFTQNMLSVR